MFLIFLNIQSQPIIVSYLQNMYHKSIHLYIWYKKNDKAGLKLLALKMLCLSMKYELS